MDKCRNILFISFLLASSWLFSSSKSPIIYSSLRPPKWIHGRWSGLSKLNEFVFTEDNVIRTFNFVETDYRIFIGSTVQELSNTYNEYEFRLSLNYKNERYKFERQWGTEFIIYTLTIDGTKGNFQYLYKQ